MESISVLIPVYNSEKYVSKAIESVLNQTVKPEEIIVIDDGSDDASAEKVKDYFPDVKLIGQENLGISGARNTAIKHANGDVIAFLDSDDYWPKDHIELLLTALKGDNSVAIVLGHVRQFLDYKDEEHKAQIPEGFEVMAGFVVGASLIRREVFDKIGLFDETLTLAETIDWFSRVKDSGIKYKLIDDIVLMRRIHSSNTGIQKRDMRHDYTKVLMASIKRKRENEKKGEK